MDVGKMKKMIADAFEREKQEPRNKYGFVGDDGQVYLEYCPKCGKENHAFFVAEGKCCWCGYKGKPEDVNGSAD